ncbi:hypothetical protein [Pseudodonghicola xiamenensis]|uniref:Uncharacterized protein n=1 Tax=Pseudodonghicola xiamenensis TaxID=337702 RepID=A0A8J3ME81_9RHOB|nr:hypothetical protein [Pseudodonghicola xiamenensis]GHG95122.1 hypothetical protein GCM10010961_28590 [Pseudodonghicola xiamenensis]
MPEKRTSFAGLLLGFRKTADFLQDRTMKTGEDVEYLLELHRLLETGEGGKAVLIERLFEEILAIRMQQSAMEAKLDEVLHQQRAMVEALNLPVASGR